MTAIKDMPTDQLANLIRAFVTGRGHPQNIVAAAHYAADCPTVLAKIRAFIDDDGWIEWDRLAEYVDQSGWSSGEKDMIRFGCSLAGHVGTGPGWDLESMLRYENGLAAAEAVRYAAMGAATAKRDLLREALERIDDMCMGEHAFQSDMADIAQVARDALGGGGS